ncbi:MAG: hypothetical protein COX57_02205 [Alphaproteobacteria bacterium CG_4_10_14_0_2_um_filter_63_37]|nr:MAG: hypothetical protein AUJ55_06630 [Proteobacteria bacterium CG1_02_64_396]PJA25673.1 MAG: hypothetical protein COX57_02205 [Alphaproteobacteria bacterium CG_4_10_14_0_2_um_filter_63_37]
MRLAAIVARLETQCSLLAKVGGAAEFSATAATPARFPAAWVVPVAETAGGDLLATPGALQRSTRTFAVLIKVRDLRDPVGESALDGGLSEVRAQVLAALHGWPPEDRSTGCLFVKGRLAEMDGGVIAWQDDFSFDAYLKSGG